MTSKLYIKFLVKKMVPIQLYKLFGTNALKALARLRVYIFFNDSFKKYM